ncbi:LysR family transcriptional regulator [Salipiger thiooxidans]|nr:LysR family transcriptional regulator [Salipiger thiooxidans]
MSPDLCAPGWFCSADDTSFDLVPLGAFLVLGETGAFGTNARHLALPQSALMRRTLKLEDALGLRLFDRTTDSLRPTRAEVPGRNSAISHTAQQAPARTATSSGESASKRISGPGTGGAAEIPGTAATVRRVNRGLRRTWDSRKNGRLTSTKSTLAVERAQRRHVGRGAKALLRGADQGRSTFLGRARQVSSAVASLAARVSEWTLITPPASPAGARRTRRQAAPRPSAPAGRRSSARG